MEHKLLLVGSIVAVVVLVLAGLSPVVSFNTAQSSAVSSPLFRVRTNRAVEQEESGLSCAYIGQRDTFLLPTRDTSIQQIQKVFKFIQGIDDATFEQFIKSLINHVQKDNRFTEINSDEIRETFYQVRDSNKPLPVSDSHTQKKNHPLTVTVCAHTFCRLCYITIGYGLEGFLGCIFLFPIVLIFYIIEIIIEFIKNLFHINTGIPGCIPPTTVVC
jgi:hypothetical protein